MKHYDVAIVGAGIVGLAHAWTAARRGLSVAVFEKDSQAQGASVRNFGMIWPIGQPEGELYEIALRSRELWLELDEKNVLKAERCGSIHLAHHADEKDLLQEFIELGTHQAQWIPSDEVHRRTSIANPDGLLGGMLSETELRVDPRTASRKLADWLKSAHAVDFYFETPVVHVQGDELETSNQIRIKAERILICSGSDLRTLFPEQFAASGLNLCKLQMLKTVSQKFSPGKNAHIASGLTLRHYQAFQNCHSLTPLKQRIRESAPELDQYGIHVMASLFPNGEIVLGDSHEYGEAITPFDSLEIDNLMIRELKKVIALDDWAISEKWHGIYAKHPKRPVFETHVDEHVSLFVGTGGAGMTLSFGLAEKFWNEND